MRLVRVLFQPERVKHTTESYPGVSSPDQPHLLNKPVITSQLTRDFPHYDQIAYHNTTLEMKNF